MRIGLVLARHALLLWRTGQLRFRAETFGLYYPHLPYEAPAWQVSPRSLHLLLSRGRAYGEWLIAMHGIARSRSGPM